MARLNTLTDDILDWGITKGILPYPDALAQLAKTKEEVEELEQAINDKNVDEVKDAIGDIFVTLVMQTEAWELTMEDCVQAAYNQIKHRTGKMVNGQFVKDSK